MVDACPSEPLGRCRQIADGLCDGPEVGRLIRSKTEGVHSRLESSLTRPGADTSSRSVHGYPRPLLAEVLASSPTLPPRFVGNPTCTARSADHCCLESIRISVISAVVFGAIGLACTFHTAAPFMPDVCAPLE
jgi:hypothetical protein